MSQRDNSSVRKMFHHDAIDHNDGDLEIQPDLKSLAAEVDKMGVDVEKDRHQLGFCAQSQISVDLTDGDDEEIENIQNEDN